MTLNCENCKNPPDTLITLHEWTEYVCRTPDDAQHLYGVIFYEQDFMLTEHQVFPCQLWEQVADLSGIEPDWNGYKE